MSVSVVFHLLALFVPSAVAVVSSEWQFFTQSGSNNDSHIFLSNGSTYRLVPDMFTAQRLGFVKSKSVDLDLTKNLPTRGPDIPTLALPTAESHSPDAIIAKELLRINLLAPTPPILSARMLGLYQNPAIVRDAAHNATIMVYRGAAWRDNKHNYFKRLTDNATELAIEQGNSSLGDAQHRYAGLTWAEDIRMLPHPTNGTIFLTYTQIDSFVKGAKFPIGHMALRTLTYSPVSGKYELHPAVSGHRLDWPARRAHLGDLPPIEKNWSPFFRHEQLHFVYSLHPLRILQVDGYSSTARKKKNETDLSPDAGEVIYTAHASLVSETRCPESAAAWEYGQMRGGTPALLVGGEYLTFFHSRFRLRGSSFETYFMGAVTFSAEPPFRLLRQSRVPLLLDAWYLGKWTGMRSTDYVVFPIGLVVAEEAGAPTFTLSLGRNDREGWVVKMRVDALLATLAPLHCTSPT